MGGNIQGGNFPLGIFRVGILPGGIFLEPCKSGKEGEELNCKTVSKFKLVTTQKTTYY